MRYIPAIMILWNESRHPALIQRKWRALACRGARL